MKGITTYSISSSSSSSSGSGAGSSGSSSNSSSDMDLGTITIASLAERCPSLTISMTSAQPAKSSPQQQQHTLQQGSSSASKSSSSSSSSSSSTMKIVNCLGTNVSLCPSVTIHAERPLSRSVASLIPASIGFAPLTTHANSGPSASAGIVVGSGKANQTLHVPMGTRIIPQQSGHLRQVHRTGGVVDGQRGMHPNQQSTRVMSTSGSSSASLHGVKVTNNATRIVSTVASGGVSGPTGTAAKHHHSHGLRRALPRILVKNNATMGSSTLAASSTMTTPAERRIPVVTGSNNSISSSNSNNIINNTATTTTTNLRSASILASHSYPKRSSVATGRTTTTTTNASANPSTSAQTTRMREVLASIPDFSTVKPKRRTNKRMSTAAQLEQTREGCIDLETPDSILVDANLRALLNKHTFGILPPLYQYKLIQLLPPVDRPSLLSEETTGGAGNAATATTGGVEGTTSASSPGIRLSSSSLNNEFFARACLEWRDRLAEGEFTPDNQMKLKSEADRERGKVDPWKVKHFEPFWGAKEMQQRTTNRSVRGKVKTTRAGAAFGAAVPGNNSASSSSSGTKGTAMATSTAMEGHRNRPPIRTTIKLRPVDGGQRGGTGIGPSFTVTSSVASPSNPQQQQQQHLSPRTLRAANRSSSSSTSSHLSVAQMGSVSTAGTTTTATAVVATEKPSSTPVIPPSPSKMNSVPDLLPIRTKGSVAVAVKQESSPLASSSSSKVKVILKEETVTMEERVEEVKSEDVVDMKVEEMKVELKEEEEPMDREVTVESSDKIPKVPTPVLNSLKRQSPSELESAEGGEDKAEDRVSSAKIMKHEEAIAEDLRPDDENVDDEVEGEQEEDEEEEDEGDVDLERSLKEEEVEALIAEADQSGNLEESLEEMPEDEEEEDEEDPEGEDLDEEVDEDGEEEEELSQVKEERGEDLLNNSSIYMEVSGEVMLSPIHLEEYFSDIHDTDDKSDVVPSTSSSAYEPSVKMESSSVDGEENGSLFPALPPIPAMESMNEIHESLRMDVGGESAGTTFEVVEKREPQIPEAPEMDKEEEGENEDEEEYPQEEDFPQEEPPMNPESLESAVNEMVTDVQMGENSSGSIPGLSVDSGIPKELEELEPTIQNIPASSSTSVSASVSASTSASSSATGNGAEIPVPTQEGSPEDVIDDPFTDAENYVLESGVIGAAMLDDEDAEKLTEAIESQLMDDVASVLAAEEELNAGNTGATVDNAAGLEDINGYFESTGGVVEMGTGSGTIEGSVAEISGNIPELTQNPSDWLSTQGENLVSEGTTTSAIGGVSLSSSNASPAMSVSAMDTCSEASRDMMMGVEMNFMDCTTSGNSSMGGHLHLQESSLGGFEGEVSSTVVQDSNLHLLHKTTQAQTQPQNPQGIGHPQGSYSEDSSPLMGAGSNSNSNSSGRMTVSPPSNSPVSTGGAGNVLIPSQRNCQSTMIHIPPSQQSLESSSLPGNRMISTNNSQSQQSQMNPLLPVTAPLVPTLGRPPSAKTVQQQQNVLDAIIPGGVAMNVRAPGCTLPVRMKVAGGGVGIPGQRMPGSASGRGRGAGSGSKPPPGAVNLERSYQICQAVIQNSPNRHQLRCQLRPPPAGGKDATPVVISAPAADTQNPMVTSSNRLVRLQGGVGVAGGGGVGVVGQRPSVATTGIGLRAQQPAMGNGGKAIENSLNVPRASSAPPGHLFPVNGGGQIAGKVTGNFRARPSSLDEGRMGGQQQQQQQMMNPKVVALKAGNSIHYGNDVPGGASNYGKATNGGLVAAVGGHGSSENASHNCSMNAMVICQKCGAFCHDDCISASKLCGSCVMIR